MKIIWILDKISNENIDNNYINNDINELKEYLNDLNFKDENIIDRLKRFLENKVDVTKEEHEHELNLKLIHEERGALLIFCFRNNKFKL